MNLPVAAAASALLADAARDAEHADLNLLIQLFGSGPLSSLLEGEPARQGETRRIRVTKTSVAAHLADPERESVAAIRFGATLRWWHGPGSYIGNVLLHAAALRLGQAIPALAGAVTLSTERIGIRDGATEQWRLLPDASADQRSLTLRPLVD